MWCKERSLLSVWRLQCVSYKYTPSFVVSQLEQTRALFDMIRSISLDLFLNLFYISALIIHWPFSCKLMLRLNELMFTYFDEEVTDQVSSLKKDHAEPYLSGDDEGLGLDGATFKWNEVVEVVEKGKESSRPLRRLHKDNILFCHPFDEGRYNTVIECCALQPDLEILEDGMRLKFGRGKKFLQALLWHLVERNLWRRELIRRSKS